MTAVLTLLAGLVLEDGRRWGEVAADWQREDVRAILEPGSGPRMHFLTRARGGSKTVDLAAVCIAFLLLRLTAGGRCFAVAADKDQARLVVDAIAGFVRRTPGLAGAISVDRFSASTPQGARLEVIPADAASSYGLRGDLFVVDELAQWASTNRDVWVSIVSAVPKIPGCTLVVLTSAGDPAHWSHGIREHARTSPAWRLNETPGPVPWIDPAALAEQRALLTDSQYARLHENRWTASEDRLVSVEGLDAALRLDGPQEPRRGVRYHVGVDLGLRHDRTAIAVCHGERGEDADQRRVVLDLLLTFTGTREHEVHLAEVERALLDIWRDYGHPRFRLDPWQGIGLAQRLRGKGCVIDEYSYSPRRYGAMAGALFGLLRDGLLDLYDAPGLVDELANVRLRETTIPGVLRIDHDSDGHDDMAVALGMAVVAVVERSGGVALLRVPEGRLPAVRALRPERSAVPTLPIAVVRDGDPDPRGRSPIPLGRNFHVPDGLKRYYTGPGDRR